MSKVKIQGNASGTGVLTIAAPNTSTDRTITLPDSTGTLATTADVPSSITDNGDATAIKIDSSERVAIGNTDAGNYYSSADNLVVYDATQHAGITIASGGTDKTGNIYFADGTSGDAEYEGYIEYNHNGNAMSIGANHTTKVRIDSDGLKFNSDTAAANALDDYEEGTWTPALTIGSATMDLAHYTKIGRTVTVSAYLSSFSNRTSTSAITITGLPFTQLVGVPSGVAIGRYIDDIDKNHCYVDANTISFYGFTTANWSQLKHNNLTSSSSGMYLSATYQTT